MDPPAARSPAAQPLASTALPGSRGRAAKRAPAAATRLEPTGGTKKIAQVNPENCVACATCVKVCPYGAPKINDLHKAEIQGAKCMGCGSCVSECPARAITLRHQEDGQIAAMLDELLVTEGAAE